MNVFWRAFYACVLVLSTYLWITVPPMAPGLLGKSNIVSLIAALTVLAIWFYGFKATENQLFWKTMMVLLTLLSLGLFTWLMSNLTLVLGLLVGVSLLSLGVLYENSTGERLIKIVKQAIANKQLRQKRAAARQANAPADQGLDVIYDSLV